MSLYFATVEKSPMVLSAVLSFEKSPAWLDQTQHEKSKKTIYRTNIKQTSHILYAMTIERYQSSNAHR